MKQGKTGRSNPCLPCDVTTRSHATRAMACVNCSELSVVLREKIEMEEMKQGTAVTKCIIECANKLLELEEKDNEDLKKLLTQIDQSFKKLFDSAKRCRLVSTKKEKLYVAFHKFSVVDGFKMCNEYDKSIDLKAADILWQLVMEKLFLRQMISVLDVHVNDSSRASTSGVRQLSFVEKNAVRYTAGFVIYKLEKKYSKLRIQTQESVECVAALREMAGRLKAPDQTEKDESCKWINLVDRGGLHHVTNVVYDLFIAIETVVNEKLDTILSESGKGLEQVKKDNLSWVCDDDDVMMMWDLVDLSRIEEESTKRKLLFEIAHLWITTRGHSKTKKMKEDYKKHKKENLKGKRSLRKELVTVPIYTE